MVCVVWKEGGKEREREEEEREKGKERIGHIYKLHSHSYSAVVSGNWVHGMCRVCDYFCVCIVKNTVYTYMYIYDSIVFFSGGGQRCFCPPPLRFTCK